MHDETLATGDGVLESSFGSLEYRAHDYLYIPMGTTYRLQPRTPTALFVAESSGQITIPRNEATGRVTVKTICAGSVATGAFTVSK